VRDGVLLRGAGARVRNEAFDGHDHLDCLDLAGNAASRHLGAEVGDFPKTVQDLFAALFLASEPLRGTPRGKPGQAGQVLFLIGNEVGYIIFWHKRLLRG
jgi:hypothetical protein